MRLDACSVIPTIPLSGEEFERFLVSTFPHWNDRLITPGFEFDDRKLHSTRGFPGAHGPPGGDIPPEDAEANKEWRRFREWNKEGMAQLSEYKVFQMLQSGFANEPCLLISGFYERNICRLAQDTFNFNHKHQDLSEEVCVSALKC